MTACSPGVGSARGAGQGARAGVIYLDTVEVRLLRWQNWWWARESEVLPNTP